LFFLFFWEQGWNLSSSVFFWFLPSSTLCGRAHPCFLCLLFLGSVHFFHFFDILFFLKSYFTAFKKLNRTPRNCFGNFFKKHFTNDSPTKVLQVLSANIYFDFKSKRIPFLDCGSIFIWERQTEKVVKVLKV